MVDPDEPAAEASPFAAADLSRLASIYLSRYAASSHRLRQVLVRKVRRWHERRRLTQPDTSAVMALIEVELARLTGLGMLDDDAFSLARARSLVRKGLPGQAVRRRLAAEHLDHRLTELADVIVEDDEVQARRLAQRKRLGPFRVSLREHCRDRDIRSLVRSGFAVRVAIAVIDGSSNDETEP